MLSADTTTEVLLRGGPANGRRVRVSLPPPDYFYIPTPGPTIVTIGLPSTKGPPIGRLVYQLGVEPLIDAHGFQFGLDWQYLFVEERK